MKGSWWWLHHGERRACCHAHGVVHCIVTGFRLSFPLPRNTTDVCLFFLFSRHKGWSKLYGTASERGHLEREQPASGYKFQPQMLCCLPSFPPMQLGKQTWITRVLRPVLSMWTMQRSVLDSWLQSDPALAIVAINEWGSRWNVTFSIHIHLSHSFCHSYFQNKERKLKAMKQATMK